MGNRRMNDCTRRNGRLMFPLEISRKWVIGGITGDGTVTSAQTAMEQDHQAMLDRIHEQLETLAASIFPLRFKAIPTYDETQSVEDLWLAVVNTMQTKHRGDMFFLYPRPGSEQAWRPSWNQVITERCLPMGKVSLYMDVGCDDKTNSDWYDGMCIEEGRVQGLGTNDPKGLS
ncbi:hypothetical protein ARMSODRAFT_1008168 [Armillaria solidipes]|uniref:Uncharacterized protein n=1 Tax=Armillaria solidipes TaxID=1076256 RepID=A0A2H3AVD4_9AGAR|nr:hypothetical protein ARMSODRAFT_1008168 [Armillaria solidipes]